MDLSLPLLLCLALAAAAQSDIEIIEVKEGLNVSLPCTAVLNSGVQYRACRWYKEGEDPRLTGLVSSSPPGGPLRWYVGADTHISVDYPSLALRLPPVSCSDSGVYQCYMAAPVGQQNREGRVRLTVLECPVEVEERLVMRDVLVLVAGLVLIVVSAVTLTCFCVRRAKWRNTKSVDKPLYPDLSCPLEKHGLFTPQHLNSALNFNRV